MPPREVACELCGGRFFAHSLPHHRKSCEKKVRTQAIECPYCSMAVTQLEMDSHILSCQAARSAGAKPTGQSAQLRKNLEDRRGGTAADRRGAAVVARGKLISQAGGLQRSDSGAFGCGGGGASASYAFVGGAAELPGANAGLVPCRVCGRTFTTDRVAKHQMICQKAQGKRRVFRSDKQREYSVGGSGGEVVALGNPQTFAVRPSQPGRVGGGKAGARGDRDFAGKGGRALGLGGNTGKLNNGWREQSCAFREAMRAARAIGIPRSGAPRGGQGTRAPARVSRRPDPAANQRVRRDRPPTMPMKNASGSDLRRGPTQGGAASRSVPPREQGGAARSRSVPQGEAAASRVVPPWATQQGGGAGSRRVPSQQGRRPPSQERGRLPSQERGSAHGAQGSGRQSRGRPDFERASAALDLPYAATTRGRVSAAGGSRGGVGVSRAARQHAAAWEEESMAVGADAWAAQAFGGAGQGALAPVPRPGQRGGW